MNGPLMPKSTAVWLVENTSLTFEQISNFCRMHLLEVQGIADGEVAIGIQGRDPIVYGELSQEEIKRCENDSSSILNMKTMEVPLSSEKKGKKPRYIPASRRRDLPDAIAWLIKFYPELSDSQISKLIRTTKSTINSVKNREHWNIKNITPRDPVLLSFCSQSALSEEVAKVKSKEEKNK